MSATPEATDAVIETDDGPMPIHVAVPAATPKGAVVVLQEAFGVTDDVKDVARRFALAGWHTLAPSLFHRQGSPVLYPEAGHGFHCDARPGAFAPGPAQDAFGRTLAWLERYGGGAPAQGVSR